MHLQGEHREIASPQIESTRDAGLAEASAWTFLFIGGFARTPRARRGNKERKQGMDKVLEHMNLRRARGIWRASRCTAARRANEILHHSDGRIALVGTFTADELLAIAALLKAREV